MKLSRIIFLFTCFVSVISLSSCSYPGKPLKYTGTIHNEEALPWFLVEGNSEIFGPMGTSRWTIGNTVRLDAGHKFTDAEESLDFFKYKSLSQEPNGDTIWEVSWQEKNKEVQSKIVKYSGKTVYAIKKKNLKIAITPPKKKTEEEEE